MAFHLLVGAVLSLSVVICAQSQTPSPEPMPTRTSTTSYTKGTVTPTYRPSYDYTCYVCDSEAPEGDHCSAHEFDPYGPGARKESNCISCMKFVGMKDGRTVTRRSCVYDWDKCRWDAETDCCQYDYCNGRIMTSAGSATVRALGALGILPFAIITVFKFT